MAPSLFFFWANRIVPKRPNATREAGTRQIDDKPEQKAEGIQALARANWAHRGSAGKMPGSGVTSRSGMGDNLSEMAL